MLTSYFPLWVNVVVNVVLPLIVLFKLKTVMFERLKLSTLVIMRALILLPIFGLMRGELFVKLILVFLAINCMEATLTDLLKNHQPFNFVTGLCLSASVFTLSGEWCRSVQRCLHCKCRTFIRNIVRVKRSCYDRNYMLDCSLYYMELAVCSWWIQTFNRLFTYRYFGFADYKRSSYYESGILAYV